MRYIIFLLLNIVNLYAVVTISPVDIGAHPGVSGTLKGSFETKRGNSDIDSYSAGARIAYDNNTTYVIWSDASFNYGESSGAVNTNNTFLHTRYIHTMYTKNLNWEMFIQSQTNEFTNVRERYLTGGGLRYMLHNTVYGKLYVGLGAFYEYISYTTQVDPPEHNKRLSLYLSYSKEFTKDSKLSYLLYAEPKFDKFSDYILINAFELQVHIYEKFFLSFTAFYNIDSVPAIGIKKQDISQKTSFIYSF